MSSDVPKILREVKVVGKATNGEDAVLLSVSLKPAVVVMDVHLPVLIGLPATTLIKTTNPLTVVIRLTAGDPHYDEKPMTVAGATTVIENGQLMQALYPAIVNAVKQVKKPI